MKDTFRGDTAALIRNIDVLLEMDAAGALVPHGVGGHARCLLEAASVRLAAPLRPPAQAQHLDAAVQEDAKDAARYRFLRDGEWRDTGLERYIVLQLGLMWDDKIDAAIAAQHGEKK